MATERLSRDKKSDGPETEGLIVKRVIQHIRDHLLRNFINTPVGDKQETWEELVVSEWDNHYEHLRRVRMILGRFRYSRFKDKDHVPTDNIKAMKAKLKEYEVTGNLECLVDMGNYCMLEFQFSQHPNKHFESQDDGPHAERIR